MHFLFVQVGKLVIYADGGKNYFVNIYGIDLNTASITPPATAFALSEIV